MEEIKYYLKSGDTEPITRLLVTENGKQTVLTDREEIQEAKVNLFEILPSFL